MKATTQAQLVSIDGILLAYMEKDEAMPEAAGDGYSIVTTEDGGLQLALYWTDTTDGTRRTVLVQGGMLKFFDALGGGLQRSVKAARNRKVTQDTGSLTRERSAAS